jgi:RNA polymerase sigma-70 factor, ECF subfamily
MDEVRPVPQGARQVRTQRALLAKRAQSGDAQAFSDLCELCRPSIVRVANGLLRDPCDVDETVQATFVAAWEHLAALRSLEAVEVWLCRIARSLCHRAMRLRRRQAPGLDPTWLLAVPDTVPSPEVLVSAAQEVDALLAPLSAPERAVVELCVLEGLSVEEAGRQLEVGPAVVKGRLQRARARLRKGTRPMTGERRTRRRTRVAVVDPTELVASLVATHLERSGYVALVAHTGDDALERIAQERPALVVLEAEVATSDGKGLVTALREDAATVDLPVVLVSHLPPEDPRITVWAGQTQGYVRKPFHPGQVVGAVRGVLGYPPAIAEALAQVNRFRARPGADPMELVPLFAAGDSQLHYEIPRALAERGDEALDALVALRDPRRLILGMPGELTLRALDRLREDEDPIVAIEALGAMYELAAQAEPYRIHACDGHTIVGSMTKWAMRPSDFTTTIDRVVAGLGDLAPEQRASVLHQVNWYSGSYTTGLLRAIAEEDRHGLGSLARELLERRHLEAEYPPEIVCVV